MKNKLEYVWLDGSVPEPNLRSKIKVEGDEFDEAYYPAMWAFDGSSTEQATGDNSDCLLEPVRNYKHPFLENAWLVLCEVLNADGTPHITNTRSTFTDDADWWFGFEQEYVFDQNGTPIGFPEVGYPKPQGEFYCGAGPSNVAGREIADTHLDMCLEAGIDITGTNAEVMIGQWEYQCFGEGAKRAADDLWMSRYIMQRLTERYNVNFNLHPKPVLGDWNGSGMHTNFSNSTMREIGGEDLLNEICRTLEQNHSTDILQYGSDNAMRLTGLHETQHIDTFNYAVSDRGASFRIPFATVDNDWKGYLEDRRPASNADPYRVVSALMNTLSNIRDEALDQVA